MWWEGTDHEPIQQYEGQEPRIKWAVLGRAGLCPSWRDHHDRGLGSLFGGIIVRSRVGCWRTITAYVTTKLTVICSHHGQGRMENINNKKKKAKPKKRLIRPKMEISDKIQD